jgi:hypothetical protein
LFKEGVQFWINYLKGTCVKEMFHSGHKMEPSHFPDQPEDAMAIFVPVMG